MPNSRKQGKKYLTIYDNHCRINNVAESLRWYALVAQLDRAHGYGPWCRGFESSLARWNLSGEAGSIFYLQIKSLWENMQSRQVVQSKRC